MFRPDARKEPTKERASIAKQAKRLLKGHDEWKPMRLRKNWENFGAAKEVETDVELPRIKRPEKEAPKTEGDETEGPNGQR